MTSVHLRRDGSWVVCLRAHCGLPFHASMSVEEAEVTPLRLLLPFFEVAQPSTGVRSGIKVWERHRKLHRDFGLPAAVGPDGTLEWYQRGKWHREDDLPAIVYGDGAQSWYRHGRLHRVGGPATVSANGVEGWFLNGEMLSDRQVRRQQLKLAGQIS